MQWAGAAMNLDGPAYPPEPQDRCTLHRATWCPTCWELDDEENLDG